MTGLGASVTDVLVVGAGPTGLVMAAELARHGVRCRIIDQASGPSDKSKALGVQSRTLEVFEDMGVVNEVIARGVKIHGMNIYANGRRIVHLSLDQLMAPYPFVLSLEQSETERILEEHLQGLGVAVEREVQLTGFTQFDEGVTARLRYADGRDEEAQARWLVGCDGAHSTVRRSLGLPFEGAPYGECFALADVRLTCSWSNDEVHAFLADDGILAAIPMNHGRYRLVATLPVEESLGRETGPTLEEFQALVDSRGPADVEVNDPVWLAEFRIHRRIVPHLRVGLVFLAGDAAHIHSPVGGQGMNTGIQDAYNLAWKLALTLSGRGHPSLLDSYHQERHPIAKSVLRGTDFFTRVILLRNPLAQHLRNLVCSFLSSRKRIQGRILAGVSELGVNYRRSPIVSEHPAGVARGRFASGPSPGERAPDATIVDPSTGVTGRLFDILRGTKHVLLLFGGSAPTPEIYQVLATVGKMTLNEYGSDIDAHLVVAGAQPPIGLGWQSSTLLDPELSLHHQYGASSSCLYLVRPDGYIGFRSQPPDKKHLQQHLGRIFAE